MLKTQQATSGTSAATYLAMDPNEWKTREQTLKTLLDVGPEECNSNKTLETELEPLGMTGNANMDRM